MWSVIIAGAVTIAVVMYMQGPIAALSLTALASMTALISLRIIERKAQAPQTRMLRVVDAQKDLDLTLPPLRERAS
jgi:hypothetical protein